MPAERCSCQMSLRWSPACWSAARPWSAARTASTCCVHPWASRAQAAPGSACTPSARWCRTTRIARSYGGRRRSASTVPRPRTAARAGRRIARIGRLRAPPSGSGSSARPRPGIAAPARAAAADAAPPAPSARAAWAARPGIPAGGTCGRRSRALGYQQPSRGSRAAACRSAGRFENRPLPEPHDRVGSLTGRFENRPLADNDSVGARLKCADVGH
jgi:hypothetical protein